MSLFTAHQNAVTQESVSLLILPEMEYLETLNVFRYPYNFIWSESTNNHPSATFNTILILNVKPALNNLVLSR
jgi:hypothetical protein